MKDIDIKLVGCDKWSLKIHEIFKKIHFIQFLCTKTVAERNFSITAYLKQKNQKVLDSVWKWLLYFLWLSIFINRKQNGGHKKKRFSFTVYGQKNGKN